MAFAFEKLIVYQKAIAFADNICAMTEKFPRGYGFLSDQHSAPRLYFLLSQSPLSAQPPPPLPLHNLARLANLLQKTPYSLIKVVIMPQKKLGQLGQLGQLGAPLGLS